MGGRGQNSRRERFRADFLSAPNVKAGGFQTTLARGAGGGMLNEAAKPTKVAKTTKVTKKAPSGATLDAKGFADFGDNKTQADTWGRSLQSNKMRDKDFNVDSAVANYKGIGYKSMNASMEAAGGVVGQANSQAKLMAKFTDSDALPLNTNLYRGYTTSKQSRLDAHVPGAVITDNRFISTSLNRSVARHASYGGIQNKGDIGILYKIRASQGTKGGYVRGVSETEFVMRSKQFRVIRKIGQRTNNGKTVHEFEIEVLKK